FGIKIIHFEITAGIPTDVAWHPACGSAFVYGETQELPTPVTLSHNLIIEGLETDAGSHTAVARLAEPDEFIILRNASCAYTIKQADLPVIWTQDSVFTYNKMAQSPKPSVSIPGIELSARNAQSTAGKYNNELAAIAEIIDQNIARNYNLTNRAKNYEILKKDLKPYFSTTLSNYTYNADTLWVPHEIFTDSAALHQILNTIIAYEGFATDTINKTTDNPSLLTGEPKIDLSYSQFSIQNLNFQFKRVETTQKATAIISTEGVSADNYVLSERNIIIMATIEEDEDAEKVFCLFNNRCAEFSEEVCSAIGGESIESCNIMTACIINAYCISSTPLESCLLINGQAVETCTEATPILINRENPIIGAIGVQTIYYNLKGEPLGTQKPATPGVYIEKQGTQTKRIVVR
ncbi:MAG: hypothetical protein FWH22_07810, partial [Fibromonadales bacterium]|nr:hypothetical protein [Fibromonadales bacterium]